MLDITYCNDECSIGKAARDKFLAVNNSAFDAAFDFNHFVNNCFKTCPHKDEHTLRGKENKQHESI